MRIKLVIGVLSLLTFGMAWRSHGKTNAELIRNLRGLNWRQVVGYVNGYLQLTGLLEATPSKAQCWRSTGATTLGTIRTWTPRKASDTA
jgi:hypothetical protein